MGVSRGSNLGSRQFAIIGKSDKIEFIELVLLRLVTGILGSLGVVKPCESFL